tara:strand:+ start:3497 stop:4147 length:651 start_codon:yes stop_codon:yes gene_type:complete
MSNEFIFVNVGFGLVFLALAIRESLWLRIILTVAYVFRLIYSFYFVGNLNISLWNVAFILVNIVMIAIILDERKIHLIPDELKDIKSTIFDALTSKEFVYLWSIGNLIEIEKNHRIIKEGIHQEKLMFILSGTAVVLRNDKVIANLSRGQFIAEMSLITSQPTSAAVESSNHLQYIEWNKDSLKTIENTNPKFWIKLQGVLSSDIAKKLQSMNTSV